MGESSPNEWLTNNAYSTSTLSNDLEKGWGSHSRLRSRVDCGWEFDTTRQPFAPGRCSNPPAPAVVMNLVKRGCKRGCKRCWNNTLPCTDVCGCVNFNCYNYANSENLVMRDMDGDE